MFKIYKGDDVIVEGESPLTITGLEPNTEVVAGEYQTVRVDGDKESERVDIPAFTTLEAEEPDPIKDDNDLPESIEIDPKEHTFIDIWEPGTSKRFNVTILPEDADQEFTVESSDESVIRASIDGTQAVGMAMTSGTATLTVETVNGLTATATITMPEQD